jgi:hypothetical protein
MAWVWAMSGVCVPEITFVTVVAGPPKRAPSTGIANTAPTAAATIQRRAFSEAILSFHPLQ